MKTFFGYNRSAFTLVELMIVIAIIGVLAASLFPMMSGYMERAIDTKTISEAIVLGNALEIRFSDRGDGQVFSGGYNQTGYGHFDYQGPGYPKSGIQILEEDGYIGKGKIKTTTDADPIILDSASAPGARFFYDGCKNSSTFSMLARLSIPKISSLEYASYACGGLDWSVTGAWRGSYIRYGFNHAYTFGSPCKNPSINTSGTGSFINCDGIDVTNDFYNHVLQHAQPFRGIAGGKDIW